MESLQFVLRASNDFGINQFSDIKFKGYMPGKGQGNTISLENSPIYLISSWYFLSLILNWRNWGSTRKYFGPFRKEKKNASVTNVYRFTNYPFVSYFLILNDCL